MKEEKIYPENCLGKLLPDFSFFENKNKKNPILPKTQKAFHCGLATNGKLFNRIVFPIRNRDGKIHGFTGRKIMPDPEEKYAKWLHYGTTSDWFYPYYTVEYVQEAVQEKNRIILLESVGDSMALWQAGFPESTVGFTNNLNAKLASKISTLGVNIVVSPNRDENGMKGGLWSLLRLYDLVDFEKLWFVPPPYGDFGELLESEIKDCLNFEFSQDLHKVLSSNVIELIENLKEIPNPFVSRFSKFKRDFKYYYG